MSQVDTRKGVLCTIEPIIRTLKNEMEMGTIYKIRCARCGAETELPRRGGYGKFRAAGDWPHIETDLPIRCPGCLHRLNASQEEFRRQVVCVGPTR